MGSIWLASGLCLSNDYPPSPQASQKPTFDPRYSSQRMLCFQNKMNFAKYLCSIIACSLQDPMCDLKDSVSLASDSKSIFHCKICPNARRLIAPHSLTLSCVTAFYSVIRCMTVTQWRILNQCLKRSPVIKLCSGD